MNFQKKLLELKKFLSVYDQEKETEEKEFEQAKCDGHGSLTVHREEMIKMGSRLAEGIRRLIS